MIQLRPGEQFPLTYQISDPADIATTYYIQAKIYNSRTSVLLTTVNLASQGGGLYAVNTQVPADASGLGLYINIVVIVYTDVGYTTKSANYAITNAQYLVQDRIGWNQFGGGSSVDYKKIEAMIKRNLPDPVTFPEFPKLEGSFNKIIASMDEHRDLASSELVDAVKNILEKLGVAHQAISGVDKKLLPPTVVSSLEEAKKLMGEVHQSLDDSITTAVADIQAEITSTRDVVVLEAEEMQKFRKDLLLRFEKFNKQLLEEFHTSLDAIDTMVLKTGKEVKQRDTRPNHEAVISQLLND